MKQRYDALYLLAASRYRAELSIPVWNVWRACSTAFRSSCSCRIASSTCIASGGLSTISFSWAIRSSFCYIRKSHERRQKCILHPCNQCLHSYPSGFATIDYDVELFRDWDKLYQWYVDLFLGWKQLPRIVYLLHSDMSVYHIIPNQCRLRLTPLYTTWSMSIRLSVDTCDILLTLPGSCLARSIRSGWIVWVIPSMALLASFVASSNFFSVSAVVLRLTCVSSIKLLILFSSFRVLMI